MLLFVDLFGSVQRRLHHLRILVRTHRLAEFLSFLPTKLQDISQDLNLFFRVFSRLLKILVNSYVAVLQTKHQK